MNASVHIALSQIEHRVLGALESRAFLLEREIARKVGLRAYQVDPVLARLVGYGLAVAVGSPVVFRRAAK